MRATGKLKFALFAFATIPTFCFAQDAGEIVQVRPLTSTLSDIGREYRAFLSALAWARFEFGCNRSEREDRTLFNARYGWRVATMDRWFRKSILKEELKLIESGEEIMTGGCLRSKNGRPVMRDEAKFLDLLNQVERFKRRVGRAN